jgi:hypothetical protein
MGHSVPRFDPQWNQLAVRNRASTAAIGPPRHHRRAFGKSRPDFAAKNRAKTIIFGHFTGAKPDSTLPTIAQVLSRAP